MKVETAITFDEFKVDGKWEDITMLFGIYLLFKLAEAYGIKKKGKKENNKKK